MNDSEIHRLLQLKACEQPSSQSVEKFILEFHRQQRAELLAPSFLEIVKERLALFMSDFQIPKMAYVAATGMALFVGTLILRTGSVTQPSHYATSTSFSSKDFSNLSSTSSQIMPAEVEPVSLDINNPSEDVDSVVSPMSYLQKKRSFNSSPLSF